MGWLDSVLRLILERAEQPTSSSKELSVFYMGGIIELRRL